MLRFLWNESALLVDKTIVISDVHIGIELEYRLSGMKMPSQTKTIEKRIQSLITETKAKKLVICGDFKHKVPGTSKQELYEIPRLLSELQKRVIIEIVQGNHDADLAPLLPKGVIMRPSEGFRDGDVYFSHGHTWPVDSVLTSKYLIIGHVQPQIEIRDKLGYVWREPVWVRSSLNNAEVEKRYGKTEHLPQLIILPAFNPLAGGLALNKKDPYRESPILKLSRLSEADIFLRDGTLLGKLSDL